MITETLKGEIDKWQNYIQNKVDTHGTPHSNIKERVKRLNNNHEHITPGICQQSRFIIDKITHAFTASLVTIYDADIFESLFIIIRPYLPEHLREYIHTFITNSPWLDTLRQGFIKTLGLIREHILASHDDNHNILLEAHINESIYNIINCWVISCVTLLFCKVLFALPTLELNLPYLFFVAGSYSIVDFAIDDNTMHPQVIRNILQLFEHELSGSQQTSNDTGSAEGLPKPMFKAIKNLVQTYTQHVDPNATKLQAIIYSMATEKECFKKQRRHMHMTHVGNNKAKSDALSIPEIITLTINKGLSTGYLILASLSQANYDICVNSTNQAQLNIFNQYCILLQLLDDLSDYTKDSAAKIITSVGLCGQSYLAFAWFVLDCVLDFLNAVQESGIFDSRISSGFNILIINYWCYCCNKNGDAIGHDKELLSVITDNYMFDMEYVLQMRDQKHKKKYELYKLLIKDLN